MGIRYQRRVGGHKKGVGFNLSGSGISSSYRSKLGSIGTKGFSLRTGIPGLYYRGGWKSAGIFGLFAFLMIYLAFYIPIIILVLIAKIVFWILIYTYAFIITIYNNWKENKQQKDGDFD